MIQCEFIGLPSLLPEGEQLGNNGTGHFETALQPRLPAHIAAGEKSNTAINDYKLWM